MKYDIPDILKGQEFESVLSEWQEQVILGSLLSTASIPKCKKNHYIILRQSKNKDLNWFRYKAEELKNWARPNSFFADRSSYYWFSKTHPCWNDYKKLCYPEGEKRITIEWLDKLKSLGLCVWFIDRGFFENKQVGLKTKDVSVVKQYLDEVLLPVASSDEKCVLLTEKATEKFLSLIGYHIPPYMQYVLQPYSCRL